MSVRLVLLFAAAVAWLILMPIGAQGVESMAGDFRVWVTDPLVKILPDSPAPEKAGHIEVDAVRNEYESAQLVVTALKDVAGMRVEVSPLKGPSRIAPRVRADFLGFIPVEKGTPDTPPEYMAVKTPAQIPDPLLEARTVSVEAGKNQPVWLTVYVPKRAAPGAYTGTVRVQSNSGLVEIPLSVRVHPVTLPDERTLYLTNWFSIYNIAKSHGLQLWSEPYWKTLEAYAWCMADHRQNVVITPIMQLIEGGDDGSGNLTFDFSRFDRWVELFEKAGVIGMIEGGHLGGRSEWEAKDFDASWPRITNPDGSAKESPATKVSAEETRRFLSQFLPALQKHLEKKGWIGIYVQHLADEPIPANAESYKKLSAMVKEFAPKFRVIDAAMCNEIAGAIDIWVPQPQHFENDIKFFTEQKKAGDEIWFYTCLSPKGKYLNRFLDYQLIRTRLMHWANFKFGLTGYLHWGFNYWRGDPFTDLQSDWLPPGDSHIVYPGKRGPMSSIRLEALRDGVEDFELLKLLEKEDPKKARAICDSIVRSMTDYTLDPSAFRAARLRLIKSLAR